MTVVELRGNKKKVVLKLMEEGDMSIYDVRKMNLISHSTKRRVTTNGVKKIVSNLCDIGAACFVDTERGEMIKANKDNLILKRSTESMQKDVIFSLVLAGVYALFFVILQEVFFVIGAYSVILSFGSYLFIKAMRISETKSVYVKLKNNSTNQG